MVEDGVPANECTYVSLLKACTLIPNLCTAEKLHAEVQRNGFVSDVVVGTALISMYGRHGMVVQAEDVFVGLAQHDVVSWSAMLLAYIEHREGQKALQLYRQMHEGGVHLDQQAFVIALQACCALTYTEGAADEIQQMHRLTLDIGQALDADARRAGFVSHVFVGSALIHLYSKCGCILEAENVFNHVFEHDVVSWSAMLSAFVQNGYAKKALHAYVQMYKEGIPPDQQTYVIALQSCGILIGMNEGMLEEFTPLEVGSAIHTDIELKGLVSDIFVGNSLLSMYSKCGGIREAEVMFEMLPKRDTVTWNTMLSAYVEKDQGEKTLQLYRQMQAVSVCADRQSFLSALQACGILSTKEEAMVEEEVPRTQMTLGEIGLALFFEASKKGFASDVCIVSAFLSMSGKCGRLVEAQIAFDGLRYRDTMSWCAMITAYMEQGKPEKALQLYRQMQQEGVMPDQQTYLITLQACVPELDISGLTDEPLIEGQLTQMACFDIGQSLHTDAWRNEHADDTTIGNAIISMYGKCGSIEEAENVFVGLLKHDLGSWNAMLSAYVEQEKGEKAFELYRQMVQENVAVDDVTVLFALVACRITGCIAICKQLHFTMIVAGYDFEPVLGRTLIRAYGAGVQMVDSRAVFDVLPLHNVASWTACITSYAEEGNSTACLCMFEEMQLAGVTPDGLTFLALLSACSRSGFASKGVEFFKSMSREYGLNPNLKHYVALIDLLGRIGEFKYVENILLRMPVHANWATWMSLLGACRTYGILKLGKWAFDNAVSLKPGEATTYAFMLELYADTGLHMCANEVEHVSLSRSISRKPDQSSIKYEQEVDSYVLGEL